MIDGKTFIDRFEAYCPQWLAEEGDPVGLHIGTLNKPIKKVMVTLDVRPEVAAEAIEAGVDLLIAKHPPIFRPIKHLFSDDPQEKMLMELVKHDIAVYAAHTNMDIVENGLNDWFCEALGIEQTTFLEKTHEIPYRKLVVFVPVTQADALRSALSAAGAGVQGNYRGTSYSMEGIGRFTPTDGAEPAIGKIGEPEAVVEERIEVLYLSADEDKILQTLREHHPYEEPAYDLLPLVNNHKDFGLGRIGELAQPQSLPDFIQQIKTVFGLEGLRVVTNEPHKQIKRVAICGGSGEKFYPAALRGGADAYITGDIYYHTGHDMLSRGLTAIDPGHNIEKLCIPKLVELFNQWKKEYNWEVEFIPSTVDTNPFRFY